MSRFDEGVKLMEDCCGGKDTVISLATVALEPDAGGNPRPVVRDVDAMYADGVFYVVTYAASNKIRQIEGNGAVAFSIHFEGIAGTGTGENLGWVLAPRNAALRDSLRRTFADWYDAANDEQDENCIILAIRIQQVSIFRDHGAVQYRLDFVNRTALS